MLDLNSAADARRLQPHRDAAAAACWSWQAPHPRAVRDGQQHEDQVHEDNVEALEAPPKGEIFAWCSDKPGWGVRILASGRKSWVVQYRIGGASKRHTIGDLRVVPITMAEQRAREILRHAKLGKDLLAEESEAQAKRSSDTAKSIGAMVAAYLSEPGVKAAPIIRRDQALPVDALEASARHERRDGQPPRPDPRAAPDRGRARRSHGQPGEDGAERHVRVGDRARPAAARDHPDAALAEVAEKARERVLDLEELAAVWRAAGEVGEPARSIVRLLILTGCRRSEIAGLRWPEIDFDKALVTIPGDRIKNGRTLTVPLAPAAAAILEGVQRFSDLLVFPSIGWGHAKAALDAKVELPHWTIHDIRRSCRSHWIEGSTGSGSTCTCAS